jgi:ketosteroid isomerase-like protein
MRTIIRFTVPLLIAGLLAPAAVAAGPDEAIGNIEKQWAAAVVARDLVALERFLSDSLIYAHSTGVVETKSEYLGKLRGGTQKYAAIDYESVTVKIHGDAAVAHARVRMRGTNAQGPFDNRLMMLHLWVKEGGRWRLAAHQTTKL